MDSSANTPSRPAFAGSAKAFMAARRRRRQQLDARPPQLRFVRISDQPRPPTPGVADTAVRALQVRNDGGAASEASLVLFTAAASTRQPVGDAEAFSSSDRWDLLVDELYAHPPHELRGYVLARGGDGRWFATTVDGRSATFRSRPDELGVLRTLGLRMPLGAEPHDDLVQCERASPGTPA
jgi:hypothetical protein